MSSRARSKKASAIELVAIIAVAIGLAFGIETFVVKPYKIPSGSMEPTLKIGQRLLVNRIGMDLGGPHVGQIVVFHPPAEAAQGQCGPLPHTVTTGGAACALPVPREAREYFVKRIVAGPGDALYIAGGHVYREAAGSSSFVPERDSYVKACGFAPECSFPRAITIAPGHWFMMGDNRGDSEDSRFWGPVPTSWIVGPALATYWPPDRIGVF